MRLVKAAWKWIAPVVTLPVGIVLVIIAMVHATIAHLSGSTLTAAVAYRAIKAFVNSYSGTLTVTTDEELRARWEALRAQREEVEELLANAEKETAELEQKREELRQDAIKLGDQADRFEQKSEELKRERRKFNQARRDLSAVCEKHVEERKLLESAERDLASTEMRVLRVLGRNRKARQRLEIVREDLKNKLRFDDVPED